MGQNLQKTPSGRFARYVGKLSWLNDRVCLYTFKWHLFGFLLSHCLLCFHWALLGLFHTLIDEISLSLFPALSAFPCMQICENSGESCLPLSGELRCFCMCSEKRSKLQCSIRLFFIWNSIIIDFKLQMTDLSGVWNAESSVKKQRGDETACAW